jgi:hypothetical protein
MLAEWSREPQRTTYLLPPSLVARILGRHAKHPDYCQYAVYWQDHRSDGNRADSVYCGRDLVWKTGGVEVMEFARDVEAGSQDTQQRERRQLGLWGAA